MIFVKENVYHNDDRHFFQSKYFFEFAIKYHKIICIFSNNMIKYISKVVPLRTIFAYY